MGMKVLFLGTGTSTGVPVIGCDCAICQSSDPRDKRLRSSILVSSEASTLLVDSSPDLRQQALAHGISHIDAVIYTHVHHDHIAGFDDMRAFGWKSDEPLPLYAGPQSMEQMKITYAWAFSAENTHRGYVRPKGYTHDGKTPFMVGDIHVTPVPVQHGGIESFGYVFRHGGKSMAYIPDVKVIPPASMELLRGLDALALDGLGEFSHVSHLGIDENIAYMQELRPQRGYVTHSGHRVSYAQLSRELPDFMAPAYDGLQIEF